VLLSDQAKTVAAYKSTRGTSSASKIGIIITKAEESWLSWKESRMNIMHNI